MKVRELHLRNVMSHADTRVVLPETGLCVVTGPNGAGKSSLVEAVALGLWGKTLRGTPAWNAAAAGRGEKAWVTVTTDALVVERSRTAGKTGLKWEPDESTEAGRAADAVLRLMLPRPGSGPVEWESTSQAQDGLERLIQGFDVWRRGCAFSASDAAHFSLATDAERKRLLEAILGIERFDAALEACRKDLKLAASAHAGVDTRRGIKAAELGQASKRLVDAEAVVAGAAGDVPEPPPRSALSLQEEALRIRGLVARGREDVREAEAALRVLDRAGGEQAARAEAALVTVRRLLSGRCASCEQDVPHEHLAGLRDRAERDLAAGREARTAAEAERVAAQGALDDLREEVEALQRQETALLRESSTAAEREGVRARAATAKARADRTLLEAQREVARLEREVAEAEAELAGTGARVVLLTEVEKVLGLKGVRAHVLARSLSGLNAVANAWLPRLGLPDLRVQLRPYAEKKSGGVTDAISVEVTAAGGGHGYKGASAGERRRIDVALLIGVAEVAGAALGRSGSTLWFDELFDGLDAEGVEAASLALAELAQDRAVVVVTHSVDLAARLPARLRLRVERGRILTDEEALALDAAGRLGGEAAEAAVLDAGDA